MIFAASLLNFETLVPLAMFGAFAALAWWVLERMAAGKPRAVERLDELKSPHSRRNAQAESAMKKTDADDENAGEGHSRVGQTAATENRSGTRQAESQTVLRRISRRIGGQHFSGLEVRRIDGRIVSRRRHAAFAERHEPEIADLVHGFGRLAFSTCPTWSSALLGRSRKQAIFLALPDALDLMVVCVEAGLGLDQAMRKVAEEMKTAYRVLAEEFALCNFQLQMGRPRAEVLHELGARTGVPDLRALAGVLIQADKFGSSVAQALRVQSDSMRIRRRQLAEEKAAKTAVKLIFPLVLFIFPGIFVVLVGPAAITMVREMFPKMGGG